MPTFDFQCTKCNSTFEFNRPFGSKKTPPCPECGSEKVQKLISAPSIQFKGDGFYKTDSQKKPHIDKKKDEKNPEPNAKSTDLGQAPKEPAAGSEGSSPERAKKQKDSKKEAK